MKRAPIYLYFSISLACIWNDLTTPSIIALVEGPGLRIEGLALRRLAVHRHEPGHPHQGPGLHHGLPPAPDAVELLPERGLLPAHDLSALVLDEVILREPAHGLLLPAHEDEVLRQLALR